MAELWNFGVEEDGLCESGLCPQFFPSLLLLLMESCFCLVADSLLSHFPIKEPSLDHEVTHDCSAMACLLPLLGFGLIRTGDTILANERN